MRVLIWLAVLATAVGAAAVGWQLGTPDPVPVSSPVRIQKPTPVPAEDPSLPWTVLEDCPATPSPTLSTSVDYVRRTQRSDGRRWSFLVPRDWIRTVSHADRPTEAVWVPPSGAAYQLRTWVTSYRLAPSEQAQWQTTQMLANYETAALVKPTLNTGIGTTGARTSEAFYSFRTSSGTCRLNYFAWLRPAGWSVTPIELSVSGRPGDAAGLEAMLTTVLNSFEVQEPSSPKSTQRRETTESTTS